MMPKLNRRQRRLIIEALSIAQDDGVIFLRLGDDKESDEVIAEIAEIVRKLELRE